MNRLTFALLGASLLGGGMTGLIGCSHEHHHHHDDTVQTEVVVRDEHGWDHRGWYDQHGDWHGYYYDERHVRHEDEREWGRVHDSEWEHRERHDSDDHH